MPIPYNMLPMEMLVAMSSAEAANAPGYVDAARMWTDVRTWIDSARTELRNRSESLLPHWQDAAAQEWATKVQAEDADLAGWAARIDAAQPSATLTTLAGAITRTNQEVLALHGQYMAALSNPLTAWAALGFQQAAGAVMTALGAQFEVAIAKTASAAGVEAPDIPRVEIKPSAEGNTPEDAIKALTATSDAMSELQTLATTLGFGQSSAGGGGDLADYAGGLPSLAGLNPTVPSGATLTSGAAPGAGTAPTLSGMSLPYGTLGGAGFPATAKPLAAKRAPVAAADIAPGVSTPAAATARAGAVPPMMPPMAGQAAGAAVRPGPASTVPTGRSRTAKKQADASHAVPADLRGRG
ncbi:hypothetical protein [Actinophytocola sp. NPDC049390]|uniref:hypothetical protein n=1 Tax=Actinophytocola sp. NPDC049390 TaxID=3363894 RepID=UPI003790D974